VKEKVIKFIDSHVHLDHIYADNADRISWLEKAGCMPVSWSFCKPVESVADIKRCLASHSEIINELSVTRFPCYYLAGIHPRNISLDLKANQVRELLLPYLDDPICLGIGEIGLETGNQHEVEILQAHLELADEVAGRRKVFGIHTPRENKAMVVQQTLDLLKPYEVYKESMVIDHCTPEIISEILSAGFWAGVTLSPVKASTEDVKEIVSRYGNYLSRIMLNTDSGTRFYDNLYAFIQSGELGREIKEKITRSNAWRFYGITGK
jgi:predicted metal-dependent TIM-barrel fold hydrolase